MADHDDPPPSDRDVDVVPIAAVISLGDHRRAPLVDAKNAAIERVALASLGAMSPANESRVEPQPGWTELRIDLEQQDLDAGVAQAERELARGEAGAKARLASLRSLRAMRSMERGDHRAAYDEWQALADENPGDADPLLTRGLFFSCADDLDTALDDYSKAAARAPDDPVVYERRGSCFVRRGAWDRALADYRRLVHLCPRDVSALEKLASALRFTNDHDAAIRVLGRAIKLAPWRADLHLARADRFWHKGARAEELLDLSRAIEIDPKNAEAYRRRAAVFDHMKDDEREMADLSRAIELDPTQAGTFQIRAYRHQRRGRHDLALADFSKAVELKPESRIFRSARAKSCLASRTRDPAILDLAIEDLTEVILDERGHEPATFWLRGHAYCRRGDAVKARDDYNEALNWDDTLAEELCASASRHRRRGDFAAQIDDLDALLVLEPSFAEYLEDRARALVALERHEEALADVDRAIAIHPDRSESHHARADVLRGIGDLEQAVASESRAIALAPHVAIYHAWRGLYRAYLDGPSAEAEADVLRAVALSRDSVEILFFRAAYLEHAERWEEAVRVHDERIEIEPSVGLLYFQRGRARLHVADDEETRRAALADFDDAIERNDRGPEVFQARADLHAKLGNAEAAESDRAKAMERRRST